MRRYAFTKELGLILVVPLDRDLVEAGQVSEVAVSFGFILGAFVGISGEDGAIAASLLWSFSLCKLGCPSNVKGRSLSEEVDENDGSQSWNDAPSPYLSRHPPPCSEGQLTRLSLGPNENSRIPRGNFSAALTESIARETSRDTHSIP